MNMQDYYQDLAEMQNCEININQDIMSITAMMDNKEKLNHLARYKQKAIDAGQLDG